MRPDPRETSRPGTSTDSMRMLDPREQMRMVGSDMRGDPRGITGRLNGAGAEFWGQGGPQAGTHHMHHQKQMPVGPVISGSSWEAPSPPTQRRNMPNIDDGTSLWGNPQQNQRMSGKFTEELNDFKAKYKIIYILLMDVMKFIKKNIFTIFYEC